MITIEELAKQAWRDFDELHNMSCMVNPAVPILYFGDYEAYKKSTLRIVTVGVNPSSEEFPRNAPFSRFKDSENFYEDWQGKRLNMKSYFDSLNSYFKGSTDYNWFNAHNAVLKELDAGFYGFPNTVLHTDLCSPFATFPKWAELQNSKFKGEQKKLSARGIDLWHKLIEVLQPHVVLATISKDKLDKIRFKPETEWKDILKIDWKDNTNEKRKPSQIDIVKCAWISLTGNSKPILFVFHYKKGFPPFGNIPTKMKIELGRMIKMEVENNEKG